MTTVAGTVQGRRRLRDLIGVHPAAVPFAMAVGLAFLLATVPSFFAFLARVVDVDLALVHWPLEHLRQLAGSWNRAFGGAAFAPYNTVATKGALLAVPVLWLAALVRSALVRTWQPLTVSAAAAVTGLIALPLVTWVSTIAVLLWRLGRLIVDLVTRFFHWIAPVLAWIVVAVLAVAVLFALYALVSFVLREHHVLGALLLLALGAVVVAGCALGWFDGILAWIAAVAHAVAVWLAKYVGPVIAWIVWAVVMLAVVLGVVGGVVAALGQVGRTVYVPFVSAFGAGRDAGCCADVAAGVGVTLSVVLTAAVTDPVFGSWFARTWADTPGIGALPPPTPGFELLLPDAAQRILASGFANYAPTVDVSLVVLLAGVGILSLLFQRRRWFNEHGARIARPVLLKVGLAIAVALPAVVLMILFSGDSEN
ncbi:hypothetical protein AB0M43_10025 [Longispora sp. NPDC051575]|uniref:hypothetical protein n=1 Tax=Longispora sp. NPDC051575 TaxID=3154943 RepID=UPI003442D923